jgi:hypothetical protein
VTKKDQDASAAEALRRELDREPFSLRLCWVFLFLFKGLGSTFEHEVVGIVDDLTGSVSVDNKPE